MTPAPHSDRPLLGILLMLGFCCLAPVGDAIAKLLGDRVSILTLVVVRFAVQPVLLLPVVHAMGGTLRLSRRAGLLMLCRTVLHILGISAMFLSLRFLPLADAVAIAFVMPFIMLLLGHLVLGEEVGRFRIAACIVGFAGTLLVIQPNFAEVGWPATLPLLVAVIFALFMLVTRALAGEVGAVAMQATSGMIALCLLAPLLLTGVPELTFHVAARADWVLLVGMGALGAIAHLLMTGALRFAPTATLAPMQYLEIPIATLVGFMLFADLPNGLAALGIAITLAAGLTIVAREQVLSRRSAPQPPDPDPRAGE